MLEKKTYNIAFWVLQPRLRLIFLGSAWINLTPHQEPVNLDKWLGFDAFLRRRKKLLVILASFTS
jgi:hypothetical protein